jgi:hypothetical protein
MTGYYSSTKRFEWDTNLGAANGGLKIYNSFGVEVLRFNDEGAKFMVDNVNYTAPGIVVDYEDWYGDCFIFKCTGTNGHFMRFEGAPTSWSIDGSAFLKMKWNSVAGGIGSADSTRAIWIDIYGNASDNAAGQICGIDFTADNVGSAQKYALRCLDADFAYALYSTRPIYLGAANIVTDTTTGMKIGTATTQKIGFWNVAPVTQRSHIADPSGGTTIDSQARTAINSILLALEQVGILASA